MTKAGRREDSKAAGKCKREIMGVVAYDGMLSSCRL